MIRLQPRPTPFPYTTLFRSGQIAHPFDIEPDHPASDRDRLEPDPGKALPPGGLDQDVGLLEVRHNILLPVTVHQARDGAAGLLRIEQRTFAQHVESDIYAAAVEDGREFDDGSRILAWRELSAPHPRSEE